MIVYSDAEELSYAEYLDFLKRTDLGSQYPRKGFESRIPKLLKNVDICITARDGGKLVGVCLGLTDFVYFLFVSDLGVDRDYGGQGIGRELLSRAHTLAGGEVDITMTTISNDRAVGFYEKCGWSRGSELVVKYCQVWDSFDVRELGDHDAARIS